MKAGRLGCRTFMLLVFPLVLAGCGKDSVSGASEPSFRCSTNSSDPFLCEHNARFNEGRTLRWPDLPIAVFGNGIADPGEVSEWTSASGGGVTFTFVGSPPASGIIFRFVSDPQICGKTQTLYDGNGRIVSAEVSVVAAVFRGPQCVRTITHETGHAIGFLDHTSDGGLMDENGGDGEITGPVAQMIRKLYSLPPGTLVDSGTQPQTALKRSGALYEVTSVYPVRP